MGYKLSTPRVGYFFNCCFILLGGGGGETAKEDQKRVSDGAFARPWIRLCERQRRASDESVWERKR